LSFYDAVLWAFIMTRWHFEWLRVRNLMINAWGIQPELFIFFLKAADLCFESWLYVNHTSENLSAMHDFPSK
jgi:hypothetical protein